MNSTSVRGNSSRIAPSFDAQTFEFAILRQCSRFSLRQEPDQHEHGRLARGTTALEQAPTGHLCRNRVSCVERKSLAFFLFYSPLLLVPLSPLHYFLTLSLSETCVCVSRLALEHEIFTCEILLHKQPTPNLLLRNR